VPGTPPSSDIDWEDVHLRVTQPVPITVLEGAVSRDGTKAAFRALQGGDDLWVVGADGKDLMRLPKDGLKPRQIRWPHGALRNLLYFLDGKGRIHMASASSASLGGEVKFEAKLTVRRDEEFAEVFDQSWRLLNENFYDPTFHGANWRAVREKYRPLVKHVAL